MVNAKNTDHMGLDSFLPQACAKRAPLGHNGSGFAASMRRFSVFQIRSSKVAALAALLVAPVLSVAQDGGWPSRTIQIVVPYTPSTGADILARVLGPKLAERWKVAVVTENRPGASGNIGTDFVAKAAPDGYTLLCTATSFGTNPAVNRKLPFDPINSFVPVIQLASSSVAVIVTPGLPAKSMREFLELARRQPGKFYYSSPGNGGPQHLAMELLKLDAHVDLVHVPYKGSGGALTDLVGGHVQAMIVSLQTVAPYVQSGKLRMLAVMSSERSDVFPDVPTLKELGFPDLEVDTWYGVFAPAGTSSAIVTELNGELNALLKQPEVRELLAKQGMNPVGGSPERFGGMVRKELARWSRLVASAGIKAD
jgi:tripartite-type tricarboxylate transporter receptor subunit TctC